MSDDTADGGHQVYIILHSYVSLHRYVAAWKKDQYLIMQKNVAGDSSFGIATGYGLDGPGSNSSGGDDFPHLYIPVLESTRDTGSFSWT